jgi:hypothetical protein
MRVSQIFELPGSPYGSVLRCLASQRPPTRPSAQDCSAQRGRRRRAHLAGRRSPFASGWSDTIGALSQLCDESWIGSPPSVLLTGHEAEIHSYRAAGEQQRGCCPQPPRGRSNAPGGEPNRFLSRLEPCLEQARSVTRMRVKYKRQRPKRTDRALLPASRASRKRRLPGHGPATQSARRAVAPARCCRPRRPSLHWIQGRLPG